MVVSMKLVVRRTILALLDNQYLLNVSLLVLFSASCIRYLNFLSVLPADKGNATVLMDHDVYHNKLSAMVNSGTYRLLKKDPTKTQETRLSRTLKGLERAGEIHTKLYDRIRPKGCRPPLLYGLPKIHKDGVPLRPIVSCIGSPSYHLSKFVAGLISPLAGKTDHYVKDSGHLMEVVNGICLDSDDVMVSYDVSSLFTNVPIQEAIDVIETCYRRTRPWMRERCCRLAGLQNCWRLA